MRKPTRPAHDSGREIAATQDDTVITRHKMRTDSGIDRQPRAMTVPTPALVAAASDRSQADRVNSSRARASTLTNSTASGVDEEEPRATAFWKVRIVLATLWSRSCKPVDANAVTSIATTSATRPIAHTLDRRSDRVASTDIIESPSEPGPEVVSPHRSVEVDLSMSSATRRRER